MLSVNSSSSEFENDKALNAILFVCNQLDSGSADMLKVFKILYFAERKHLARFGSPILEDDHYIAMPKGPVPSKVYKKLGDLRDSFCKIFNSWNDKLAIQDHYVVKAQAEPDIDFLSETEIECLNESIQENRSLGFTRLSNKSHDYAWNNTVRNGKMSFIDIAKAEGADEEALRYINEVLENKGSCASGFTW